MSPFVQTLKGVLSVLPWSTDMNMRMHLFTDTVVFLLTICVLYLFFNCRGFTTVNHTSKHIFKVLTFGNDIKATYFNTLSPG